MRKAEVIQFYSDTPSGTIGVVVKEWQTFNGKWYKLFFGCNLYGKKLYKSFHQSVIKLL